MFSMSTTPMPIPCVGNTPTTQSSTCRRSGLRLYELPPKRPQINGAVERCNGSWRYEFYASYGLPRSVEALNPILDSFQHLYKHHRPHGALAGQTPAEYLKQCRAHENPWSHVC